MLPLPTADGWVTPGQATTLTPAPPDEGEAADPAVGGVVVAAPLRLRDPDAADAVAQRLVAGRVLGANDWLEARTEFTDESRRTLAILGTATLLALLATSFTLATAVGGRVLADRRRIGLLRSVGVTPGGVTAVLVGHYLTVALLAVPLGLLGGRLLAPSLLGDTLTLLGTPQPAPPGVPLAAVVLLLVLVAVALACAVPAWRAGRLPPVVALQPVRGGTQRASRAAHVARALRLPVTAALGAKDAYVQRARAALTVASLALAAAMLVCALAFEATMDRLAADPALRAQPWDVAVFSDSMPGEEVERLLGSLPGVEAVGRRYGVPVTAGGIELEARVIDGSPAAFAFAVPDGRGVRRAGEVTLGRGALEDLGVEIGDRVSLTAGDRPFSARVVGRHVEPDADGRGMVALADTLPAASLRRPSWVLRLADGADPARAQAEIERLGAGRLIVDRPGESLRARGRRAAPDRLRRDGPAAGHRCRQPADHPLAERARAATRHRHPRRGGGRPPPGHEHGGDGRSAARAPGRARRPPARRLAVHDAGRRHRPVRRSRRRHPAVVAERRPGAAGGAGRGGAAVGARRPRGGPRGDRRGVARRVASLVVRRGPEWIFTELIDKVVYAVGQMPATDLHQHLWPDGMLRLLARRTAPPRLRRDAGGWTLELAGEAPAPLDLSAHDAEARAATARTDGLERVLVAPSTPLGIEALPAREAQPLLDAFHAGVLELGAPFGLWGSAALAEPAPGEVDALLDAGAAGLCLPAEALGGPDALARVAPLLERLEARGAPLLVHPGAAADPDAPAWWPALTSYVAAMQAAWLAWAQWGRPAHPELKVVWAMLAGGAPLHVERLAARGGPAAAVHDERAWFDVSSYGPKAVDAMLRVVGVDRLVHGSDRPVVDPPSLAALGPAFRHAVTRANPAGVLS